jgi:hypothetical protein
VIPLSKKYAWMLSLAVALMCCAAVVPQASASGVLGSYVMLYDNDVDAENATTDYKFYVGFPDYLSLDADYWNFTVYGFMVNNTGAAVGETYVLTIYIYDGTTNVTANSGNMVLTNTSTSHVYGNISINSVAFSSLTENDTATVYMILSHGAAVRDDSMTVTPGISETYMGGMLNSLIPMMISIFAIAMVFGLMSKMFVKMKFGK